jgi:HEAT repeat protein
MALVALCSCACACVTSIYESALDGWRRDIRDPNRCEEAIWLAADGKVRGISKGVAVTELASALSDPEPAVRYYAARWLPKFGVRADAAARALIAATRDPHRKVRQQGIHSLLVRQVTEAGSVASKQAVVAATRALADHEPLVRCEAAHGLIVAGHGDEALQTLVRDLKDSHLETASRVDVVWCLSRMGTKAAGAIPALQEVLRDVPLDDLHSRMLRVEAASILVRLGVTREAMPVLQYALQDKAQHIREVVARPSTDTSMNPVQVRHRVSSGA